MTIHAQIMIGCWVVFLVVWSAFALRRNTGRSSRAPGSVALRFGTTLAIVLGLILVRSVPALTIERLPSAAGAAGSALCVAGVAFAVWARVSLGRSWGMPMTLHEAPALVTSGPYRYVRHPIYTGMSAMVIGTALVFPLTLPWSLVMLVYMIVSARREELDMTRRFPDTYPAYRQRSKMLVPFVL